VGADRSGERALQKNDGAERRSQSANRAESGSYRIGWSAERLFLPLTLRSHALVRGASPDDDDNDDDDDYDYERSKNLKKTTYLRTYHTLPLAVTVIIRLLTVTS